MSVPVLLLPGTLTDERLFTGMLDGVAVENEIAVVDLPDVADIAEMATRILERAPDRFALGGLSLGGIVAMEIYAQAPERVEGLALLDTNHRMATPGQLATWARIAELLKADRFTDVLDELEPQLSAFLKETSAAVRSMAMTIGADRFSRQNAAQQTRQDNRSVLSVADVPVLVLCGSEDLLCPVSIHQELANLIPDSKLWIVEGAGHLSTLDRPDEVGRAISWWIDQMETRKRVVWDA